MRLVLFLCVALGLAGCQSLQTQGEAARERARKREGVVVTNSEEDVADCRLLTEVTVAQPFPFMNQAFPEVTSFKEPEIRKALRREAHQAGADTVLRTGQEKGVTHGKAYDCR